MVCFVKLARLPRYRKLTLDGSGRDVTVLYPSIHFTTPGFLGGAGGD